MLTNGVQQRNPYTAKKPNSLPSNKLTKESEKHEQWDLSVWVISSLETRSLSFTRNHYKHLKMETKYVTETGLHCETRVSIKRKIIFTKSFRLKEQEHFSSILALIYCKCQTMEVMQTCLLWDLLYIWYRFIYNIIEMNFLGDRTFSYSMNQNLVVHIA